MKSLSKKLIIFIKVKILLLLFFTNAILYANIIEFIGVNKNNQEIITLDSVRIINESINIDTVVINNNINTDIFTNYQEYLNQISFKKLLPSPLPFEDYTHIPFYLNSDANCSFYIYDLNGKVLYQDTKYIKSGYFTIKINALFLNRGIYFFRITDNQNSYIAKLIKLSNSTGNKISIELLSSLSISNEQYQIQNLNDSFTFIAYSSKFFPDTLLNINIINKSNIRFELIPLSKWNFSGVDISVNIPVLCHFHSSYDHPAYDPEVKDYDYETRINRKFSFTNEIKSEMEIGMPLDCKDCKSRFSVGDTGIICNKDFRKISGADEEYCYTKYLSIEFIDDFFANLYFMSNDAYGDYNGSGYNYQKSSNCYIISLSNVKYEVSDNGEVLIQIFKDEILDHTKIGYGEHYEKESAAWEDSDRYFKQILELTDESFIQIELYPE